VLEDDEFAALYFELDNISLKYMTFQTMCNNIAVTKHAILELLQECEQKQESVCCAAASSTRRQLGANTRGRTKNTAPIDSSKAKIAS
jgi:hypothetical protein